MNNRIYVNTKHTLTSDHTFDFTEVKASIECGIVTLYYNDEQKVRREVMCSKSDLCALRRMIVKALDLLP